MDVIRRTLSRILLVSPAYMILSNRAVRKLVSDVQSFCKEEIHLFLYLVAHHISKKKKRNGKSSSFSYSRQSYVVWSSDNILTEGERVRDFRIDQTPKRDHADATSVTVPVGLAAPVAAAGSQNPMNTAPPLCAMIITIPADGRPLFIFTIPEKSSKVTQTPHHQLSEMRSTNP